VRDGFDARVPPVSGALKVKGVCFMPTWATGRWWLPNAGLALAEWVASRRVSRSSLAPRSRLRKGIHMWPVRSMNGKG
jgi:hypothetical protein